MNIAPYSQVTITTDGPVDSASVSQEARWNNPVSGNMWHGFYLQSGRDITIDTKIDRPIQSLSIEMEQKPGWGVYYPSHVDFEVENGDKWYMLGSVKSQILSTDKSTTTQVFSVNTGDIQAHMFRLHFPVGVWVFARNLQVLADNFAVPGNQTFPDLPTVPATIQQPMRSSDERDHDIRNMALVYTGSHGSDGNWSTQDFLALTSYLLPNGKVGGRMFDSVLFLPYSGLPDTQVGWQDYISNLFAPNQQLQTLDRAVQQTNTAMNGLVTGDTTFKENVVVALPYPRFDDTNWGTLNGKSVSFTGSNSDPDAILSRQAALEWYIRQYLTQWKSVGYDHLNLVGFYWLNEKIDYTSPGDPDLIHSMSDTVHNLGYPLFWIPYYDAPGLADWKSSGFDAAWLQPNFVFQGKKADPDRLTNAETLAADYGLGLELEIPWQVLTDPMYQQLYLQSIKQFEDDGMAGNVSHAFYAGSKTLVQAAQSSDPNVRAIYDRTYEFIIH